MNSSQKRWLIFGIIIAVLLIGGAIYRYNWWTFVDNYEQGYRYDKTTGTITILERTGWERVTPMLTEVHTIDTRPMQIRIEANNRVLNAMLVRFKKEGLQQFIDLHGRGDYDQVRLADILKSYAYEGMGSESYSKEALQKKYKFLEILGNTSGANAITTQAEPTLQTVKDTLK